MDQFVQFFKDNAILILIAAFLFKDQLASIFSFLKKPLPAPDPAAPAPTVPAVPVDRPLINLLIKDLLPVILPLVISLIQEELKKDKEKASE